MHPLIQILRFTKSLWRHYLGIIISATITAATALAVPFVIARATDVAVDGVRTGEQHMSTIMWLAVGLLGLDIANSVATNVNGWLGDVMSARMRKILSSRYFEKLLTLPQSWFDRELTGTITSRLTRSIDNVITFAKSFSNNFFTTLLTTVAVLVISAFYYWPLTILLAVIFPLYVWLTTLTSRDWQAHQDVINTHIDTAGGRFQEVISQIRVVKSFVTERSEQRHFDEHYDATIDTTRTQASHWHRMDTLRRLALNVIFFGCYALIFVQTARGFFTVGAMVLLIQLMNMARQPIMMMSYIIDTAQRAIAGSRDYFAVMSATSPTPALGSSRASTAEPCDAEPLALTPLAGEPALRFDDVSFSYDGSTPVITHVGFDVHSGERVALVGESGGGKSTLVNLLLGLYAPCSGTISVLGHDISTVSMAQLRRQIGVVFQDPSLFSGTIRENIAYGTQARHGPGTDDAVEDDERIRDAAHKAFADRFIRRMPEGYDTLVGERGIKLSGGQKQRIAIARAIVKDAPILVLDEATSALDTKSERWVQAGLESLMADRTSLIIAHRLSTISSVDRIITLDSGRVDEIGTPEELATSGGIYAELLALQASSSRADRKRLEKFGFRL